MTPAVYDAGAQVSRSPAQVQLRRLLRGCEVVSMTEQKAHAAGQLPGRAGTSEVRSSGTEGSVSRSPSRPHAGAVATRAGRERRPQLIGAGGRIDANDRVG
jgi:hypothetical protein